MSDIKDFSIVFCIPKSRMGKIVTFFSGKYSHIGIFYKGNVYSARPLKGVVKEPISLYEKKYLKLDIIPLNIDECHKYYVEGYMFGSLGKGYSILQYIRIFLMRGFNLDLRMKDKLEMRRVVCSEWIYWLLLKLGCIVPQENVFNLLPDDIYNLL